MDNQTRGGINIKTCVEEMELLSESILYRASVCYCYIPILQSVKKLSEFLHKKEKNYYDNLMHDRRKKSYLLGRYSAKRAISYLFGEDNLQEILIQPGVFSQPINSYSKGRDIQVSITHSGDFGAAVAFPEALPMGIDMEKIDPGKRDVMESQMTEAEKGLIRNLSRLDEKMLTLLWSTKESLSKVLKTGLTTPFYIYEIDGIKRRHNCFITYFKNFGQYKALSFTLGEYMCSISYPKSFDLNLNVEFLKYSLDSAGDDQQVI